MGIHVYTWVNVGCVNMNKHGSMWAYMGKQVNVGIHGYTWVTSIHRKTDVYKDIHTGIHE